MYLFVYKSSLCFQNWNLFLSTRNYKICLNLTGVTDVHVSRMHPSWPTAQSFSEFVGMRHKTRPALHPCTPNSKIHAPANLPSYQLHCIPMLHCLICPELAKRGPTLGVKASTASHNCDHKLTSSSKYMKTLLILTWSITKTDVGVQWAIIPRWNSNGSILSG